MLPVIAGKKSTSICTALLVLFAVRAFAQQDPPSRVARLNYINGTVSMEPAGIDEWAPAAINRPFTTGDYLYADQKSVAELHMDVAAIRIGEVTSFGFLNLDDQISQIKLTEGDMYFRLHDFGENQTFEIDTPNAAITFLRNGVYRIHVDPNANSTFVVVRNGQAEITGGGQAFTLNAGNSASLSGTDELAYDVESAPAPDVFDTWCEQRDAHEERPQSARYLPPTVIGSEDLDDNGVWNETPDYGAVWYPRQVDAGWAPYHNGHWAWIEPWGWTWVDDAPWGFAPFHYGRWVYWHERWGWAPGPIAVAGYGGPILRPVYSPALVAWFGGEHWGVSVSLGGGPSLGWVPLGFGEIFTPHYACSRQYFSNVNVHNTRIERNVNITNVYNTVYVNHAVYNQNFVNVRSPNAVVAMPQNAFANGRSVRQAGMSVRPNELARFRPAESTIAGPGVAPTRQAVAPTIGEQAAHPPAQIAQRQVLARTTPPPPSASFAARQNYIQQHIGQPHNFAAMHQAVVPPVRQVAQVRQVPAEQPVATRPGRSVGTITSSPSNRPDAAPRGFPAPQERSNQRGAEQQVPQAPPTGHGTPPNMHPGYNASVPRQGIPAQANRPNGSPQGFPASQERSNQRGAEQQQVPQGQQPSAGHGAPPNVHSGYNAPVPQQGTSTQVNRPNGSPQGLPQERSNQRGAERQVPQAPQPPAGHGTPPNTHPGYNAPASSQDSPREQPYSNRPNERPQQQPRYQQQAEPGNPEPPSRPARNQDRNDERLPPRAADQTREQPRYVPPPRSPVYEPMRPAEQPRNVAPPPRPAEPQRPVEPSRPVERNQPEARPQSRPEPHSDAHGDGHHDDKK